MVVPSKNLDIRVPNIEILWCHVMNAIEVYIIKQCCFCCQERATLQNKKCSSHEVLNHAQSQQ